MLKKRLLHGHTDRPLLQNVPQEDLLTFIEKTSAKRGNFYSKAKITIDADNYAVENTVRFILNAINRA